MGRRRTREQFPRMKVRGGRRRHDAQIKQAWHTVERFDFAALGRSFHAVGQAALAAIEQITDLAERLTRSVQIGCWVARRVHQDRWISTHQLPAHPSPWAAPIREEI